MIYFDILRFSFLRFLSYPYEILAEIARTIVMMTFLMFFWSLIINNSSNSVTILNIISYFLIATGIKEIVMAQYGEFGGTLGRLIKSGEINNYLMKPNSAVFAIYATSFGRSGLPMFVAAIMIMLGLVVQPPQSIISILLFIAFFINALLISFANNLFEGTLCFHTTEASGMRNSVAHIVGVLSGIMVPLYMFPDWLEKIVRLTPFPAMVFGPTIALSTNSITSEVMFNLGVATFWSILLNIFALYFWRSSTKKYEAIGI
jgi:ABC-2 type transport system permease protein